MYPELHWMFYSIYRGCWNSAEHWEHRLERLVFRKDLPGWSQPGSTSVSQESSEAAAIPPECIILQERPTEYRPTQLSGRPAGHGNQPSAQFERGCRLQDEAKPSGDLWSAINAKIFPQMWPHQNGIEFYHFQHINKNISFRPGICQMVPLKIYSPATNISSLMARV